MKSTLVKICIIAQFVCMNSTRPADNFTDSLNAEPNKKDQTNINDLLKIQLNALDEFHISLLKEHNYYNRLSWCWRSISHEYRQKVTDLTHTAMHYILADGANPNIASDISQIRILHVLSALIGITSVDYVERLVVNYKANPLLKDAYGNDAFSYAQQIRAENNALYQRIITALHKYKKDKPVIPLGDYKNATFDA